MNEKQIREAILTQLTIADKDSYNVSVDAIVVILKENGLVDDKHGMKLTHYPERIIPEETIVEFDYMDFSHLVVENGQYNWELNDAVKDWLKKIPHTVDFDCGDFGEGMPIVSLTFVSQCDAVWFTKQWGGK